MLNKGSTRILLNVGAGTKAKWLTSAGDSYVLKLISSRTEMYYRGK